MSKIDLSKYDNSWYYPGGSFLKRLLWYFVNEWFFTCGWNVSSGLKIRLLRLFGAKVGQGVTIKPHVNIKYPWHLIIGDWVWIGEGAWIDNLADVTIASNAVLSQGAMLLCGNHNYKLPTFDLIVKEIHIEEGVWIGAQCTVCQGVTAHPYSMLCVGSVASHDLYEYGIYKGNPAVYIKKREIIIES